MSPDERQQRIESGEQDWEDRGPRWVHWLLNKLHGKPLNFHNGPGFFGWRRRTVQTFRCKFFCHFCHGARAWLREQKRLDRADREAQEAAYRALPSMQELLERKRQSTQGVRAE